MAKKIYPRQRSKIEAIWTASCTGCKIAGYDFQRLKRSNPPDIDDDPIIIDFPMNRMAAVLMGIRE